MPTLFTIISSSKTKGRAIVSLDCDGNRRAGRTGKAIRYNVRHPDGRTIEMTQAQVMMLRKDGRLDIGKNQS